MHILVREPDPELIVRVMLEAIDHDIYHEYVAQIVETIKRRGYSS